MIHVNKEDKKIGNILDLLGKRMVFLDGATGTYLQQHGLVVGSAPEKMNITNPEIVIQMHKGFLQAGSDIIYANTFGANRYKYYSDTETIEEVIEAAILNAKQAVAETVGVGNAYVALDIGPTGKLLPPMGNLSFKEAYECFKEMAVAGEKFGADLVVIETMSDLYESKAAILAVKENTNLPVFSTVTLDESGKILTGADIANVVTTMESIGVDALGVNCGLGPKHLLPLVEEILSYSSTPVIVKPNAGLPQQENGKVVYKVDSTEFGMEMQQIAMKGAWIIGGCCGTKDTHIQEMVRVCKDIKPKEITKKDYRYATSYSRKVNLLNNDYTIGRSLNVTYNPELKNAILNNDWDYIEDEGYEQQDQGADLIEINIDIAGVDIVEVLPKVVNILQNNINLPLKVLTANEEARRRACKIYNGQLG